MVDQSAVPITTSSASSHSFLVIFIVVSVRRVLAAILAVSAVLSVVGCGGKGSSAVQSGSVIIFAQPSSQGKGRERIAARKLTIHFDQSIGGFPPRLATMSFLAARTALRTRLPNPSRS